MGKDKINKSELLAYIAKQNGITHKQARSVFDSIIDYIRENICEGKDVSLTGFGTFSLQKHKGHPVQFASDTNAVKDYVVVKFTASDALMTSIRKEYENGSVTVCDKK